MAAVLVVAGSPSLLKAVHRGTRNLQATAVVTCSVREAPTRAAELRPLAIVMHEDVYAFDSTEFHALARDVRAELITVATAARGAVCLAEKLEKAISSAFERRRR